MKKLNPVYLCGVLYAHINYKMNFHRFRKECQRAETLRNENNGKRFRVFKDRKGKYLSLSGDDITFLKNKGVIKTKTDLSNLSKSCLYDTLTHTNMHPVYRGKYLKLRIGGK